LGLRVRACPRNGPPGTPTFASVEPASRRLPAAQPQPLLPTAAAFLGRVAELTLDTPPSSRPGDSDRPARRRRPAQPGNRCPAHQWARTVDHLLRQVLTSSHSALLTTPWRPRHLRSEGPPHIGSAAAVWQGSRLGNSTDANAGVQGASLRVCRSTANGTDGPGRRTVRR
jgi:hypothetical protein